MIPQCIVCDKELKSDCLTPRSTIGIVYDATIWRATGNYGSGVYDPMGERNEWLEAYICDNCLRDKGKLVKHVEVKKIESGISQTFEEYNNANIQSGTQ